MIAIGIGSAVVDTVNYPAGKLTELGVSATIGTALGAASRLGTPGRVVSIGVGTAMLAKMGYDELTGDRWSKLGTAMANTWHSGENMQENIAATKDSLGAFLVDTAVGFASAKVSSLAVSRLAPPGKLLKHAFKASEKDNGAELMRLQDRWENPHTANKYVDSGHEVITYSRAAVPGTARGDLIRVARTPEGNLLLAAMDVEGHHRVGAAKKAAQIHAAIDNSLPKSQNKTASDVMTIIDKQLNSKDELSVTAGMMIYNPRTHNLQTATASSEFAFVVRNNGNVQQLDAKVGGLPLGVDMYATGPFKGNESIHLSKGDTVIMVSDGISDRWGYMNISAFRDSLRTIGPNPSRLRDAILKAPEPKDGADDASFLIFHRK